MSRKPRLLIVSGSYPDIRCGVAGHVRIIAQRTAQRGEYDVEVLTSRDPLVRTDLSDRYQVHPLIEQWTLRRVGQIGRQILARRPDIVHLQNPTIRYRGVRTLAISALGLWLKCRAPRIRLVVMQHDIAISEPLGRWRYYPLLRAADAVVVSNRRDYQAVRDLGIAAGRIYRAPVASHFTIPGQQPTSKAAARRRMDIPADALCVVYFGFVHPERNVDILLRALAALRRGGPAGPANSLPCEMRQRLHGLILGGPSPGAEDYYHACQRLANRLGLSQNISWTGYAAERQVLDGLAAGDVFVNLPQRGA
ncbi:MAG: glycosyltransferase, partial [Sedimentisphaerales bacterium]|nr:glycosyltransferase [Sedimentisphaerales bacterium]